jgi:hypothetical protein
MVRKFGMPATVMKSVHKALCSWLLGPSSESKTLVVPNGIELLCKINVTAHAFVKEVY